MKAHTLYNSCAILLLPLAVSTACNFPSDGTRDRMFVPDVPTIDVPNPIDIPVVVDDVPDPDVTEGSVTCPENSSATSQVCEGQCVETATSPRHCGMCGNPCAAGAACVDGVCTAACTGGTVRCQGRCVDPRTNPDYCGADNMCGNFTACVRGQVCIAGRCTVFCPANQVNCGGNCIDPLSNPSFCGASADCTGMNAGASCTAGQVCSMGRCGASCPVGFVNCMGNCVDPQSNTRFCGANNACAVGSFTACAMNEICSGGRCSSSCGTGTVRCGNPPSCIDPQSNNRFCGARLDCAAANAGTQCALGELCLGGRCVYTPPPSTVLSTSADDQDVRVRHSPDQLKLSATQPVTFYYTLDGSLPMVGVAGTSSAVGQTITLPTLAGLDNPVNPNWCRTVRWFADYGAPFGREDRIHTVNLCNVLPNADGENNYETVDQFRLTVNNVDNGALAVVAAGTPVVLSFRLRTLNSPPGVPQVPNARIARVFLQGVNTPGNFCHWYGAGVQPVGTGPTMPSHNQTIMAPAAAGRYAIQLALQPDVNPVHCALPINLVGVRTLGYIIVR